MIKQWLRLTMCVAFCLFATGLSAQYVPLALLVDGDLNPGTGGTVQDVSHPSVSPNGTLAFDGDDTATTLDDFIWVGSGVLLASGDSVTVNGVVSPGTVDNIDDFFEPGHVNDAGQVVWDGDLDNTPGGANDDEALAIGLDVIMQEGTIYPALSATEDPGEWNSTCIDAAGNVFCEVDMDGSTLNDEILIFIPFGGAPEPLEMNVFSDFREGSTIVGGDLDSGVWDSGAFFDTQASAGGHLITDGNLDEQGLFSTTNDVVLVRKLFGADYELLAQEGDTLTLPSGTNAELTSFQDPQIASNGDWVSEADTNADAAEDNIVIGDLGGSGFTILCQEDQDISALTGIPGTVLGFINATAVNANGRALISATIDDDGVNIPTFDEGIFLWEAGVLSLLAVDEIVIPNRGDLLVDYEGDNISFNDLDQIWFEGDAGTSDGIFSLEIPAIFPVENVACAPIPGTLTADVTWTTPAGQVYDGFNIYVDGALETTLAGTATSYTTLAGLPNTAIDIEVEGFAGADIALPVGCTVFLVLDRDFTTCNTPGSAIDSLLPPVEDVLTVVQDVPIRDLTLSLDVTHTFQGDLDIQITSPFGTTVELTTDNGGSNDNVSTTFADFGSPISGNLNDFTFTQPEGPGTMADFACELSGGDWVLTVDDDAGGDTGTLDQWCLNVYEETDPLVLADVCCPGPSNLSVVNLGACGGGGIQLAWTNNFAYDSLLLTRDDGITQTPIALLPTDTGFNDLTAIAGVTYTYALDYTCQAGGTVNAGVSGSATADPTFVPEITDFVADVQVCNGVVELTWNTNGVSYTSVELFAGGNPLAPVTGLSSFTDNTPTPGSSTYSLVAECGAGNTAVTNVTVDFTLAPISNLVCTVSALTCDGIGTFTWENNDPYTQIELLIDGVAASPQPGPADTSYTTAVLSSGVHVVELIGSCGGIATAATSCTVDVFVPPAGETDLILALEGRETTATTFDPGLVDSVSALQAALIANGQSVYVTAPPTSSDPDFTTQLPCGVDLTAFDRVWVMAGTFPDDYRLSVAEGDFLANLNALEGVALYFESGDHWGFQHVASLLDARDGSDDLTFDDGDDSFTAMDAVTGNLTATLDVDFPTTTTYTQDQTGTDWNDELTVATTDLEVTVAEAMWVNNDDTATGELPYITGIYAEHTIGPPSIVQSWEFGGFDGDRTLLAANYLDLLGVVIGPTDPEFVRGDANADGTKNIADAISILSVLFPMGTPPVPPCESALDANDDGGLNIADAVALLAVLFPNTSPPPVTPDPSSACGVDPTPDSLTCDMFGPC